MGSRHNIHIQKHQVHGPILASGLHGAKEHYILEESWIKVNIRGANAGNTLLIEGRIFADTTWKTVETITGNVEEQMVDVACYDYIRYTFTVFDPVASEVEFYVTGIIGPKDPKETEKFNDDGEVRVTGEFTPSGLTTAMRVTTLIVGDTAIAIPTVGLTDRNAISIHNKSATDLVYLGNSDVTADTVVGTTSGWELLTESFINIDVTNGIPIYARCETGKTATIKILEFA